MSFEEVIKPMLRYLKGLQSSFSCKVVEEGHSKIEPEKRDCGSNSDHYGHCVSKEPFTEKAHRLTAAGTDKAWNRSRLISMTSHEK